MVTEGNVEDVDKAIAAAKKSFYVTREWRDMDSQTRADILLQIADAIDAEKEDFAKLDCMDHGKPLRAVSYTHLHRNASAGAGEPGSKGW